MVTIKLPTGTFEYDPANSLGKTGGFGQVFLGKSSSGQDVAVKKLHLSAADAAHRELRIADELRGRSFAHVVPFIDAGEDADTGDYFVVMSKADGSLQDKVIKNGPITPQEAASILLQIVNGLSEVDELVHRDLKPENVLFYEGKWMIADFGIARFFEEKTASNTLKHCLSPYYAAPEQWRLERATHATDIYALGCIAFCLLEGNPPFKKNPQYEHQNDPVPSFSCVEPRLSTLVNMCLRKIDSSRPSLSRVHSILMEIVDNPQTNNNPSALVNLAVVAAHVSSKEQESQARLATESAKRDSRLALGNSAYAILADNIERLWGKIHSQAANAKRNNRGVRGDFECQLGIGKLLINLSNKSVLEPGIFINSGWDVVAHTQIMVDQQLPHYRWSASLWFTKLKGGSDYRWYETSYWRPWRRSGNEFEPHAENPGSDADFAASHIMHSVNLAFGPIEIDDERENDFHDRWIWLLSKAATGELRSPSRLPIDWPPQLI